MYDDENLLMISGIQHFYFCKRQWMLIHQEQQWAENLHTVQGEIFHENVDNPFAYEKRKDRLLCRSLPLISYQLGFYGVSDAVEFIEDPKGCSIQSHKGTYRIVPIEYKKGRPKESRCDIVQLCLQSICLEEMLHTKIEEAFLFYGKTRRRERILLTESLREEVQLVSDEMHQAIDSQKSISPQYTSKCKQCSLYHLCLPKIRKGYDSVEKYLKEYRKAEK